MNTTIVTFSKFPYRPGHLAIAFGTLTFMTFVIWKIYKRLKSNGMKPINLLHIHFLTELALCTAFNYFLTTYGIETMFSDSAATVFCFVNNFLNYYTKLSMECSSCILHYEKYLYLKLKSSYGDKRDNQSAWDKIASSKIIIFFVTGLGYFLDTEDRKCQNHDNPELNGIQKRYIFWVTIPHMVSTFFIFKVLLFACHEKIRCEQEKVANKKTSGIRRSFRKNQIQSISAKVSLKKNKHNKKNETNNIHLMDIGENDIVAIDSEIIDLEAVGDTVDNSNWKEEKKNETNNIHFMDIGENDIVAIDSEIIDLEAVWDTADNSNRKEDVQNDNGSNDFKIVRKETAGDMF